MASNFKWSFLEISSLDNVNVNISVFCLQFDISLLAFVRGDMSHRKSEHLIYFISKPTF